MIENNLDVGLLHKFNQMAESYGLNPMDFIVSIHHGHDEPSPDFRPWLDVEAMPVGKDSKTVENMLRNAGFSMPPPMEESPRLEAKADTTNWQRDFYNAMNDAIKKAPPQRSR